MNDPLEPEQAVIAENNSPVPSSLHTGRQRLPLKYLLAVLISFCVYLPFFFFTQPVRVGDGSEYYAMAVAWAETHRPYMTETGWAHYDLLYASNAIPGINGSEELRNFSPELMVKGGQDFNHFWFYSLGAAVIAEMGDYSGINIPIHTAFLIWHCVLLALLLIVSLRYFGWRGLLVALLLTFLSPAFWYLDKVHSEFFTFCLATIAVIYFIRRKYFPSAFFLALAATQNISFSFISLFVLGIGIFKRPKTKWKADETILLLASVLVNLLHPAYYLLRYGTPDPQFLSGGAQAGLHLSHFWIWLLDPDVGLLPNWWFGIVLLLLALIIAIKRKFKFDGLHIWLVFCLVYLVVSLFAQGSTVNLNSGASPGLARYGLWYLALFFPLLMLLIREFKNPGWKAGVFSLFAVLAAVYSGFTYLPTNGGTAHCQPSTFSWWLQKNLPGMYDPPAEIFAERFSGICENIEWVKNAAIIAPDCRKVLISNYQVGGDEFIVTGAAGCNLDFSKVSRLISRKFSTGAWTDSNSYYRLSREEVVASQLSPIAGDWYAFSFGSSFSQSTGADYRHWGLLEDWGVWSVGKQAELSLPCPSVDNGTIPPTLLELELKPFITEIHPQLTASISLDGEEAWSGTLTGTQIISMAFPAAVCTNEDSMTMRTHIDNPVSRTELGISGDMRKLGIGVMRLRYVTDLE